MFDFKFEWDEDKNKANQRKHGISFNEAAQIFDDDDAIYRPDLENSKHEDRFIIIGFSEKSRLLFVCHCFRDDYSIVRIISARKAKKKEINEYMRR